MSLVVNMAKLLFFIHSRKQIHKMMKAAWISCESTIRQKTIAINIESNVIRP